MPPESLRIEDQPGTQTGQRILRLNGALVMTTMFEFQATVRADASRALIIDFTNVPCQKGGRSLALVGVCKRIQDALAVTRVEQFFRFFDSVSAAEQASGQ